MLSCKCLNVKVTTSSYLESIGPGEPTHAPSNNNNNNGRSNIAQLFETKVWEEFGSSFDFLGFLRNISSPLSDISIGICIRPLVHGVELKMPGDRAQWHLFFCLHCKQVVFARRLGTEGGGGAGAEPTLYYVNMSLRISENDYRQRCADKRFSEVYNILIHDDDEAAPGGPATGASVTDGGEALTSSAGIVNSASNLSINSQSNQATAHVRQHRLQLMDSWQQLLSRLEIQKTNERIEKYTEQQFALLKSYQEKCDQEGTLLKRTIKQLPDKVCEMLEHCPSVSLDTLGGVVDGVGANYATGPGARRRNTISSRRDLGVPTTPTTQLLQPPNFLGLTQEPAQQKPPQHQQQQPQQPLPSATVLSARKMSNFDTPPATPEATPMSVGNSPTFRQQQQQQQQNSSIDNGSLLPSTPAARSSGADEADDCLFDLEDVDEPSHTSHFYHHHHQQHHHLQRLQQQQQLQHQQHRLPQQNEDNMSDADEAEDALDLDTSLPITMRRGGDRGSSAHNHFANFARSLPVEIANSPLAERANNNNNQRVLIEDEEVLDNTVDIAASIKALARSVHGEAVFGDLPRPRLRSQI